MNSQTLQYRHLDVKNYGKISVVNFLERRILGEKIIQEIGETLFSLIQKDRRYKIILDFSNVHFVEAKFLHELCSLDRALYKTGGNIVVCSIAKEIFEAFETAVLNRLFVISADEQTALESFGCYINPYLQ